MPNIKSAKKRVLVTSVKNANNQMAKTALKTVIKKFDAACAGESKTEAAEAFNTAAKYVDRAAAEGLLHKNNASRKKSSMQKKLNALVN